MGRRERRPRGEKNRGRRKYEISGVNGGKKKELIDKEKRSRSTNWGSMHGGNKRG